MKKLASLLLAAALSLPAFAQLPKHELTIDVFGGISQLAYELDPAFAGDKLNAPPKLAGGFGFGYTYMFAPKFGLRTGVEAAHYRGEVTVEKSQWIFHMIDGADIYTLAMTNNDLSPIRMKEIQNVFSVQVPLMLQFITPINARQSNHFYAALGARFLFNVAGNYNRIMDGYNTEPIPGEPLQDGKVYGLTAWGSRNVGSYQEPHSVTGVGHSQSQEQIDAEKYIKDGYYLTDLGISVKGWEEVTGLSLDQGTEGKDSEKAIPGVSSKGNFKPKLFNLMASGELGFRWGLGKNMGLYTGLYVDYGIFSMVPSEKADFIALNADKKTVFADKSVLAEQYNKIQITATDDANNTIKPKINDYGKADIASRLGNLGAGLKLRLAFGVGAKPHEHSVVPAEKKKEDKKKKADPEPEPVVEEVPEAIQKTMADLSNTMFDFDKYVIKETAKEKLDEVVKWLNDNPDIKIEVAGHTDNWGSDEYNQKLSENRAKAVYNYFISKGIDKSRLKYAGYGETHPIATNETDEGRAQNRRVELTIIE